MTLETQDLFGGILDVVNLCLDRQRIRISTATIVDATIIAAPISTKNSKQERGSQMHQTRKGNQYHFGAIFSPSPIEFRAEGDIRSSGSVA